MLCIRMRRAKVLAKTVPLAPTALQACCARARRGTTAHLTPPPEQTSRVRPELTTARLHGRLRRIASTALAATTARASGTLTRRALARLATTAPPGPQSASRLMLLTAACARGGSTALSRPPPRRAA
eukprot:Rmarinus@m.12074